MADSPVSATFLAICERLELLTWDERRRVLAGVNQWFAPEYDTKPADVQGQAPKGDE